MRHLIQFTPSSTHLIAALFLAAVVGQAQAADPVYTGFFNDRALSGYDAVAYFTDGKPRKGRREFSTSYQGATWQFASSDHLAAFTADPERYAPQYGGYCAWAVAQGNLASANPENWTIRDGRLYLNYDDKIQARWSKDPAGFINQADAQWPGVLD